MPKEALRPLSIETGAPRQPKPARKFLWTNPVRSVPASPTVDGRRAGQVITLTDDERHQPACFSSTANPRPPRRAITPPARRVVPAPHRSCCRCLASSSAAPAPRHRLLLRPAAPPSQRAVPPTPPTNHRIASLRLIRPVLHRGAYKSPSDSHSSFGLFAARGAAPAFFPRSFQGVICSALRFARNVLRPAGGGRTREPRVGLRAQMESTRAGER